eukprot:970316-Amphidinium_carterae.4
MHLQFKLSNIYDRKWRLKSFARCFSTHRSSNCPSAYSFSSVPQFLSACPLARVEQVKFGILYAKINEDDNDDDDDDDPDLLQHITCAFADPGAALINANL